MGLDILESKNNLDYYNGIVSAYKSSSLGSVFDYIEYQKLLIYYTKRKQPKLAIIYNSRIITYIENQHYD